MASSTLIKAIAATAELCGKVYTPQAAAMFAQDLNGFDERSVLVALTRCRKELDGKPFNVVAVISRIDDGRPGVEEAWSMLPYDESQSVVWTDEMCQAWGVAAPLLEDGDKIGARMAFKEVYAKAVTLARDSNTPAKWTPSLGHDLDGREVALIAAVNKGRLALEHVKELIPSFAVSKEGMALLSQSKMKMIATNE